MIEERTKRVWFSPAANKHYFTKRAAIHAQARSLVEAKYPSEPYERDTGAGWSWREDDRLCKLVERLYRRMNRSSKVGEREWKRKK